MAGFKGFGPKALPFFKALKFHQSKAWFDENRALYDDDVVAPMVALLEDLTARFANARIPLKADGKRSMFRIHRDVRFARDKSPYKTHAGAVMTRSGDKNEQGLLYIHIDPEGCFVASGFYMPEPKDLARLRKAVVADAKGFGRLEAGLAKAGLGFSDESRLTRLPRGFEALKGSALEDAVRLKSFTVSRPLAAKAIRSPDLVGAIVAFGEEVHPLLRFGWKALD